MKKILIWTKSFKSYSGFPRTWIEVPDSFKKTIENKFKIAKLIPVPWQSLPVFDNGIIFNVIEENEDIIYKNNLCGYCGVKILDDQKCVRWKSEDIKPKKQSIRILSDTHPMHLECMRQTRIFCPRMKKTKDDEYEYGTYIELRKNADNYIK
jgi:hypothetical protein